MIEICGELYNLQVETLALKHLLEGTTIDQEVDVSATVLVYSGHDLQFCQIDMQVSICSKFVHSVMFPPPFNLSN
jgi:hypothetical protein